MKYYKYVLYDRLGNIEMDICDTGLDDDSEILIVKAKNVIEAERIFEEHIDTDFIERATKNYEYDEYRIYPKVIEYIEKEERYKPINFTW